MMQASLVIDVLPFIKRIDPNGCDIFALKGGTAINLFYQDFPRLSVDIDLVYNKFNERKKDLEEISTGFSAIAHDIMQFTPYKIKINQKEQSPKIFVYNDSVHIKIEVNTTFRGSIQEIESRRLMPEARRIFDVDFSIPTLSGAELYAGKMCAALDRQHPRDIFDIGLMMQDSQLLSAVPTPFVGYILSHNRPTHELLDPNPKDIDEAYVNAFEGMSFQKVPLNVLEDTRSKIFSIFPMFFTKKQLEFILSFTKAAPNWELSGLPEHASRMPSIRWKLLNLERLKKENPVKFQQQIEKTEDLFSRFSPRPETSEDEDAGLSPC